MIRWLPVPPCLHNRQDIRLTIDTKEDFCNAQQIYRALDGFDGVYSIEDIVAFLDKNPLYEQCMVKEIQKNAK